jgi:hypothetical protein
MTERPKIFYGRFRSSYLLITKLRCLQKNDFGHTIHTTYLHIQMFNIIRKKVFLTIHETSAVQKVKTLLI